MKIAEKSLGDRALLVSQQILSDQPMTKVTLRSPEISMKFAEFLVLHWVLKDLQSVSTETTFVIFFFFGGGGGLGDCWDILPKKNWHSMVAQ